MRANLARAARHFDVAVDGEPVFGWRLCSIGARGSRAGTWRWLRVVSDYPQWASGDGWTGNADANALLGIAKPQLLDVYEWDDDGRRQRAELFTLLPGTPVSTTDVLHRTVHLPERWWAQLRANVNNLRNTPTGRINADQPIVSRRSATAFGAEVRVQHWEMVHGDLHWANLLFPKLGILDWELWGRGPVGTDAATLYFHSLLVPAVANRVRVTFADVLEGPDGRIAQLAVAARMLGRIEDGDYPELEHPLREHIAALDAPQPSVERRYRP
ncbi:MAG: phosphotransferase [Actinophytocola sp.]|nr:phosphotransferase [Actinophytocola sp.]